MWKVVGDNRGIEAFGFCVSAMDGALLRVDNHAVHFDITGNVSGWGTPGLAVDTYGNMTTQTGGTLLCPNPIADLGGMRAIYLQAVDSTTQLPISGAEAYADADGDYVIPISNGQTVDVEVYLRGPYWKVMFWDTVFTQFEELEPTVVPNVETPAVLDDIVLNEPATIPPPTPSSSAVELATAQVNCFVNAEKTWRYIADRVVTDDDIPGLHDSVNFVPNMGSPYLNNAGWVYEDVYIVFGPWGRFTDPPFPNYAYSTMISHEYGHYLLYHIRSIPVPNSFHRSFHEGFGDTLGHMVHDQVDDGVVIAAQVIGFHHYGCDDENDNLRAPLDPSLDYPQCDELPEHTVGMVLSGVWLDLAALLQAEHGAVAGLEVARQLHVDWMFLTDGGESNQTACTTPPPINVGQSAHPGTLIEVLTADDTDGDLSNGTPNDDEICQSFAMHDIFNATYCGIDSLAAPGSVGIADCNRDGAINILDLACFQRLYAAGSRRADLNHDGAATPADFARFMERLREGTSTGRTR